jgi:TonB-linked SusC/RagA family outer membrane protein
MKMVSKLPGKLDSYDALMARNLAIEHELNVNPDAWVSLNPQAFIDKYRNQQTQEERERFVNVDWQDIMFKKHAMSYNANLNILGGTKFVRYFASADFVNEADMFKQFESDRGYDAGFGYNKITVRSNLDFNITPITTLKVNLSGSLGSQKTGFTGIAAIGDWGFAQNWAAAYNIAPDVFVPKYEDGSWGYYPAVANVTNSPQNIALSGISKTNNIRITTDFILEQSLRFITEGLTFRGSLSFDNTFVSTAQRINDLYNNPQNKWVDPYTGKVQLAKTVEAYNKFDYAPGIKWTTEGGSVDNWSTQRNLNYQLQLNYANTFGAHDVTLMGMFGRQEYNRGSAIPSFREDWVFRTTYSYGGRYHLEYNGAYNGSEKFSSENRFAFFNSGALGWTISEEGFFAPIRDSKIIDYLKARVSYGEIGDDGGVPRFAYVSEWAYGGSAIMTETQQNSPYQFYKESKVGNKDVHWEVVRKLNIGVDYSFAGGMFAGSFDVFRDKRTDVYVAGSGRATPAWFGQDAVAANLGEIHNKGYEIEVRFNKDFQNGMRLWANLNFTHAENEVIKMDDPELLADYRKSEGYAIGQTRAHVSGDRMQSFDDLLAAPKYDVNNNSKLAGDFYIVDFNGDGVVDSNDSTPYGFAGIPQNTYNATIGLDWKGWSCFAQFYGVNNVTRDVNLTSFGSQLNNVYDTGTWWSENPNDAEKVTPRWGSQLGYGAGIENLYDGSYFRLKNVELAYTFNKLDLGKFSLKNLKLFVSGNNLWVWTKMPDDRESNFAGASNQGQYPTVKRVNFGLKFSL